MTIKRIDLFAKTFQLRNPYTIAYDSITAAPNLLVRIETDNGLIGWGNAAPDAFVTGETIAQAEALLTTTIMPALFGREARALSAHHEFLQQHAAQIPAACAAIDTALYDLFGKSVNLPLYKLLGWARPKILTSITIGIAAVTESVRQARELVRAGFRALKIKTGANWEEDAERIRAIRAAIGPTFALRIDANQGYTAEQALAFCRRVAGERLEFVEQPTAAKNIAALKAVRDSAQIPIMADESALTSNDVLTLAASGAVDMINLKLMKTGGITSTMQATAVAAAGKMPVMLGCNDESRISIAAGVHLACALGGVHYADLDGAFDLVDDVAAGGFVLQDSYLIPSDQPGLGVDVKI